MAKWGGNLRCLCLGLILANTLKIALPVFMGPSEASAELAAFTLPFVLLAIFLEIAGDR